MPRYELDVTRVLDGKVEEISRKLGITKGQVIRDAISTFDVLFREVERGKEIAIINVFGLLWRSYRLGLPLP